MMCKRVVTRGMKSKILVSPQVPNILLDVRRETGGLPALQLDNILVMFARCRLPLF